MGRLSSGSTFWDSTSISFEASEAMEDVHSPEAPEAPPAQACEVERGWYGTLEIPKKKEQKQKTMQINSPAGNVFFFQTTNENHPRNPPPILAWRRRFPNLHRPQRRRCPRQCRGRRRRRRPTGARQGDGLLSSVVFCSIF